MDENLKELPLKEKVDKLIEFFDKQQNNEKKAKFPSIRFRVQKFIFSRLNWILVMFIRTNGSIKLKKVKPVDNTIKIGDTIYDCSADYIMRYKRFPMIILTEWNMKPFSPADNFKQAVAEGTMTSTEKVIMAKMEKDAIKGKWSGSMGKILVIIGIIAGGLYALNYFGILSF